MPSIRGSVPAISHAQIRVGVTVWARNGWSISRFQFRQLLWEKVFCSPNLSTVSERYGSSFSFGKMVPVAPVLLSVRVRAVPGSGFRFQFSSWAILSDVEKRLLLSREGVGVFHLKG